MSEEIDVGTDKLREDIEERRREATEEDREARRRPHWLDYLAISTALFAVFAAASALEAGNYANEALYKANQAVLQQTRAVDVWSEYQADSIKKYQQRALVTILGHVGGTPQEISAANDEAARRQTSENQLKTEAQTHDEETARLNEESLIELAHHHRFAIAVTLFQVAIGLAAIAALLKQRSVWYGSLAAGAFAALVLIDGFTMTV